MLNRNATNLQGNDPLSWQQELARAVSDPLELLDSLGLEESGLAESCLRRPDFRLRVPRPYIERMSHGDPADPLLLQVLPVNRELEECAGFSTDPVGDLAAELTPGVLQKYQGRALMIATGACGVHCRYCFRRHYPYSETLASVDNWQPALDAIGEDESITEVILSGGDPLSLSDDKLGSLIKRIETIPHVQRLRLHTRLPVVIPTRVTPALLDNMAASRLQAVVVVHINHANEIDAALRTALQGIRDKGITLLNQSVLLARINDRAELLAALSEALFEAGVLPYYLHQLDRVSGAAHYAVSDSTARDLHRQLRSLLPGYLVPRLVREQAGQPSKSPI